MSMTTSVQSFQMAEAKSDLIMRVDYTDEELIRLRELRKKETEYSGEELDFMYRMHLQT